MLKPAISHSRRLFPTYITSRSLIFTLASSDIYELVNLLDLAAYTEAAVNLHLISFIRRLREGKKIIWSAMLARYLAHGLNEEG